MRWPLAALGKHVRIRTTMTGLISTGFCTRCCRIQMASQAQPVAKATMQPNLLERLRRSMLIGSPACSSIVRMARTHLGHSSNVLPMVAQRKPEECQSERWSVTEISSQQACPAEPGAARHRRVSKSLTCAMAVGGAGRGCVRHECDDDLVRQHSPPCVALDIAVPIFYCL